MRTSSKPLGFGDVDENTPRVDLGSIDSSIQAEIFWKNAGGLCNPELVQDTKVLNLFEDCSVTYHGRAHEELSFHDTAIPPSITNLLFSYIVPHGPQNQIQSAQYYRPRFGLIPIDNLPPFCTAAGVDCWSGVAYQGYNRTLGSTPFEWGFDVRRARGTQFYASFTSGTGNPELSVGFGSPVKQCLMLHQRFGLGRGMPLHGAGQRQDSVGTRTRYRLVQSAHALQGHRARLDAVAQSRLAQRHG